VVTKRDQQLQTFWWHFIHVSLVSWASCVLRTIDTPDALPHSFYSRQTSPCLWDTPTLLSTEQSTRARLKRPSRFDNLGGEGGESGRESCQLLPDCVHNCSYTALGLTAFTRRNQQLESSRREYWERENVLLWHIATDMSLAKYRYVDTWNTDT